MKTKLGLILVAFVFAAFAGTADAKGKGKKSRGGSGTPTNYGCMTLAAGTEVQSPTGDTTKRLLTATYSCYLCNMDTRVCTLQSPSTLYGWTFVF